MTITVSQGQTKNLQALPVRATGDATGVKAGSASWSTAAATVATVTEDGGNQLLAALVGVAPGATTVNVAARDEADTRDVAIEEDVVVPDASAITFDLTPEPYQIDTAEVVVITATARDSLSNAIVPVTDADWSTLSGGAAVFSHAASGALSDPGAPTVTPQGTPGTTIYGYVIVAENAARQPTAPSSGGTTTTGPLVLDVTNFNRLTWGAVAGASTYSVWRQQNEEEHEYPGGMIGRTAGLTLDDTGQTPTVYGTPGATNVTGAFPKRQITGVSPGLDTLIVTAQSPGGAPLRGEFQFETQGAVGGSIVEV